ncbi:antigen WC1.1-like [Macrotis lagotis]|uniref:antigen WC1.1-like n=1 Tax=Macrotis lagotis TaxID=92651 RepID=UPI003D68A0D5
MVSERFHTAQSLVLLFFSFLVTNSERDKVRLRGGKTQCSGRVEVWHDGSWGTVCDARWDLNYTKVVCRELGCGSAEAALGGAAFGPGNGTIWLLLCTGTESSLHDCYKIDSGQNLCGHESDAGVMCSGFVKLVAGDGPCTGMVEVNSGENWNTVCDWNFNLSTAKVICAELQCGTAVSIMGRAHFGGGNGYIWDKEFQCNGSEPLLSMCPTVSLPQGKCHHSMDVGVTCSRYTDFRLMNGSSQCEGRVEIQVLGTWRTLCDSHWDLADANVLCHQLNCGVAMKPPEDVHFDKGSFQVTRDTFYCTGTESNLWNCPVTLLGTSTCFKGKVASAVCSGNQTQSLTFNNAQSKLEKILVPFSENGQLRLVNGGSPCSGRVEVYYNGTWGTICDDSWDMSDAYVVCRQLGCGVALKAMTSAHFGEGLGPIWLDELNCYGNESHLGECPSLHWGQHDCKHKEDAGVLCSESLDLRLVSDDNECTGWLEIFYNGTWGSVCSNSMNQKTVSVICRHLNCGDRGNIVLLSPRENVRVQWIDKINCHGQESLLWHCPSQSWDQNSCHQEEETYITCEVKKGIDCPSSSKCTDKDRLRLRGGETSCLGRVEVWHAGSWGTVCDDFWDLAEANVVCQQLDCGSALNATRGSEFTPGNGTIWLDDVQCTGRESSLWHCPARPWGENDCKHEEDAGVICSGQRTTLPSIIKAPDSGIFPLLGILCLILGALLFLVFIFLGIQMHRGRVQKLALSTYEDSLYEAVYQEIDYQVTGEKEDLLNRPEISYWPSDTPGDGYDDVEELSGSEIPTVTQMNKGSTLEPTTEWNEYGESDIGQSPKFFGGPPASRMREDDPPMSSEDMGYDEAEIERDKLRLRGGETLCSGRVEVWHDGSWGTVCDAGWDLKDAKVVCRELGCGSAVTAPGLAAFGPGSGTIWLSVVQCTGRESSLWDCRKSHWGQSSCGHGEDAGVRCSGFVKLVAGDGPCNGRVEVNSGENWNTVCDWNFNLSTAKVICAELQCGTAVSIMERAHFGEGNGYISDKEFHCNGSEPLLSLCPTVPLPQGKCQLSMAVGVICSRYTDFRLMNGSSRCEGRVEIQVLGTWRALCESHWDLADANVLCHQLNCGVAMKSPQEVHFGKGSVQVTGDTFYCTGTESHLWDCPVTVLGTSPCAKATVASVVCSGNQTQSLTFNNAQPNQEKVPAPFTENGQLRLLNGGGPCSGRIEVYYNGTWGTICDDSWDMSDAHVVCRQLGCGVALKAMVSAHFGEGSGPIWLDELSCSGNESHLGECPSPHWGQHDCRHKEDAGVLCSESLDLRLMSDGNECSGWLEIFYNGTWGSVCYNSMDHNTVSVICRHLSCGVTGNIDILHSPRGSMQVQWIDKINCQGQESLLWHCPSQSWNQNSCNKEEESYIICRGEKDTDCPSSKKYTEKDRLQLRGGKTPCSGRVEVWHDGSWGTVCDDFWDLADANVVCQQLDCGSALNATRGSEFTPGNGNIWLDDVQCTGKESSLWDCPARPWGQSDCKHEEDAGVMCSGERTPGPSIIKVPDSSIFPLLGIFCLILGALLFLVLVFLGIQMHRGRIQKQLLSRYEDSLYEAVYQEIDYQLTGEKKDLLNDPDISHWPDDAPGYGYDDVEELSGPENAPVTQMDEGSSLEPTTEWDKYGESQTGQSPKVFGDSLVSRMRDDPPPSFEDMGYDEAEIGVPPMSF